MNARCTTWIQVVDAFLDLEDMLQCGSSTLMTWKTIMEDPPPERDGLSTPHVLISTVRSSEDV